jgi:hypothetical protein
MEQDRMPPGSEAISDDGMKSALVVLGMHRSGTSALSRALSFLGYAQPSDLVAPQPDNSSGSWEAQGITSLNTSILDELGAGWDQPKLLFTPGASIETSRDRILGWIRERHLAAAEDALAQSYDGEARIVVKDPRICLLTDLWETALAQSGYEATYLLIHRNPLEVARSLKARDNIGAARAQQLWLHYNLGALGALARQERGCVVAYSDLLEERHALIERLSETLGIAATPMTEDAEAELDHFFDPKLRHHNLPAAAAELSPLVPAIVKRLQTLLHAWNDLASDARQQELTSIGGEFEQHSLFAGNFKAVQVPEKKIEQMPEVNVVRGPDDGSRKLLLHYHLFKNAGTSVDQILKKNFADRWVNQEFPPRSECNHQEEARTLIIDNPHLAAISSHTLMMPVPEIEGVEILPIVFVRHPLDRLKSAYTFERTQEANTEGAVLAKRMNFAGYLRTRLATLNDRSCRNFHTHRLAMAMPDMAGTERDRAFTAVDRLAFIGLVECFEQSIQRLEALAQRLFPEFRSFLVWANASRARDGIDERVAGIRSELGEDDFAAVLEANHADVELYEKVAGFYAADGARDEPIS